MRNGLALSCALVVAGFQSVQEASAVTVLATTTNNQLVQFDSATPALVTVIGTVTGLAPGDALSGIDFRPIDGTLVGLGTGGGAAGSGRIYSINISTAVAMQINPTDVTFDPGLHSYGVDFNPVPNALRIVNTSEDNRRITIGGTGVINIDGELNPGNPNIVGAAYSNNIPGGIGGQTMLYVIDSALDQLLTQGSVNFPPGTSPNTGTLFLVGSLGIDTTDLVGFDISAPSLGGVALASLTTAGVSTLYSINLATGAATPIGGIAVSGQVTGHGHRAADPRTRDGSDARDGFGGPVHTEDAAGVRGRVSGKCQEKTRCRVPIPQGARHLFVS